MRFMPTIKLKQNSPEYSDDSSPQTGERPCDVEGCPEAGAYRAPKSRICGGYYHFCLLHVQEYNNSWDYFDGMSQAQVHEEMLRSLYGDRPTWSHKGAEGQSEHLRDAAWRTYTFSDEDGDEQAEKDARQRRANAFSYHHDSPEYHALALFGLEPPLDLDGLKKRYKDLVKQNHPDLHGGDDSAEERLKEINQAYTVLKDAFGRYESLFNDP